VSVHTQGSGYCYESTGRSIAPCFACGAFVPKGLVVYCSGIYDWCPVCAPGVPGHAEASERFWRAEWDRRRGEDAARATATGHAP
jgi:hypothetical protein